MCVSPPSVYTLVYISCTYTIYTHPLARHKPTMNSPPALKVSAAEASPTGDQVNAPNYELEPKELEKTGMTFQGIYLTSIYA